MHRWVIEGKTKARGFYRSQAGIEGDRRINLIAGIEVPPGGRTPRTRRARLKCFAPSRRPVFQRSRHSGTIEDAVRVLMTLAALAAIAACGSAPLSPDGGGNALTLTRLRAEPFSFTFYSGLDDRQRIVVRDQTQWREIWQQIWKRTSPVPDLPSIDFTREMVIVAADGSRPTGGYNILIERASDSGGAGINVIIRSVSPGRCGVTQGLTQPVDIARLTRREGVVTFTERAEVQDCS